MIHKEEDIILTEDGSKTIRHALLDETYHSSHGAVQEALHVFIKNGVQQFQSEEEIFIFEVGLGTGLNALLTLDYACQTQKRVNYTSIEAFPISQNDAQLLNYQEFLSEPIKDWGLRIHQIEWEKTQTLLPNFIFLKIQQQLQVYQPPKNRFHCIYFDAFSPTSQPEMWSVEILQKMYNSLKEGGLLVTYCAKGQFKRDLKAVEFQVEAIPGPPGKREMTWAWKKEINL